MASALTNEARPGRSRDPWKPRPCPQIFPQNSHWPKSRYHLTNNAPSNLPAITVRRSCQYGGNNTSAVRPRRPRDYSNISDRPPISHLCYSTSNALEIVSGSTLRAAGDRSRLLHLVERGTGCHIVPSWIWSFFDCLPFLGCPKLVSASSAMQEGTDA